MIRNNPHAVERKLSDIPNQEGFKFIGVLHNGELIPCTVYKKPNGNHAVTECSILDLRSWMRYDDKTVKSQR